MKNIYTTEELRKTYQPEKIWHDVEAAFTDNYDKLIQCLSQSDCPLNQYSLSSQISLLEAQKLPSDEIIKEVADSLKDAVYFLLLSKKDRTKVIQSIRSFHLDVVQNQLNRINLLLADPEIGQLKIEKPHGPKHKTMESVFNSLKAVKRDLEEEVTFCHQQTRAGYLTSLQQTMGPFFYKLNSLNMNQKDQITLVQQLFDSFHVDWDEGDRENIKLSLQQPALDLLDRHKTDIRRIPENLFSKQFSEDVLADLIHHTTLLKKKLRRF